MSDHDTDTAKQTSPAPVAAKSDQPLPKTAPMKVFAGFQGLPGTSKTGSIETEENNALWLGLSFVSTNSEENRAVQERAVSRGHSTLAATHNTPLVNGLGLGKLDARLKYATDIRTSFKVTVGGVPGKQQAEAKRMASAQVISESQQTGKVSEIIATVEAALTAKFGTPVTVTIESNAEKVHDSGNRQLSYRTTGPGTVMLDIQAVPAAVKTITTGGTSTTNDGFKHDGAVHGGTSNVQTTGTNIKTGATNSTHQGSTTAVTTWRQRAIETMNRVTTSYETNKGKFSQSITDIIDAKQRTGFKKHEVTHTTGLTTLDKQATESDKKEEGDKNETNFWGHLRNGLSVANVIAAPFAFNPLWKFGLSLAKDVANELAVDGVVHFINTDTAADSHDKQNVNVTEDVHSGAHGFVSDHYVEKKKIKDTVDQYLSKLATEMRSLQKFAEGSQMTVTTNGGSESTGSVATDAHVGNQTITGAGGSLNTHIDHDKTVTLHYDQVTTESFLRPELKATTQGDVEIGESG